MNWDNRCKLDEGHQGEHIEAGEINPTVTASQTNQFIRWGWIKVEE